MITGKSFLMSLRRGMFFVSVEEAQRSNLFISFQLVVEIAALCSQWQSKTRNENNNLSNRSSKILSRLTI
jgi:hypothetical protein